MSRIAPSVGSLSRKMGEGLSFARLKSKGLLLGCKTAAEDGNHVVITVQGSILVRNVTFLSGAAGHQHAYSLGRVEGEQRERLIAKLRPARGCGEGRRRISC